MKAINDKIKWVIVISLIITGIILTITSITIFNWGYGHYQGYEARDHFVVTYFEDYPYRGLALIMFTISIIIDLSAIWVVRKIKD